MEAPPPGGGLRTCAKPPLRRCRAWRGATRPAAANRLCTAPLPLGRVRPRTRPGPRVQKPRLLQGCREGLRAAGDSPAPKGLSGRGSNRGHTAAVPAGPPTRGRAQAPSPSLTVTRTHFLSFPTTSPLIPREDSTSPTDKLSPAGLLSSQGVNLPLAGGLDKAHLGQWVASLQPQPLSQQDIWGNSELSA